MAQSENKGRGAGQVERIGRISDVAARSAKLSATALAGSSSSNEISAPKRSSTGLSSSGSGSGSVAPPSSGSLDPKQAEREDRRRRTKDGSPVQLKEAPPEVKLRRVDKDMMESRVKKKQPFEEMDFRQCDFSKMSMVGARFISCRFRGAHFKQTDLTKAEFVMCDLREVEFTKAILVDASLAGNDLRKSRFFEADLTEANISNAQIEGASFAGANMKGIGHAEVDLNDANIKGAKNLPLQFRSQALFQLSENLPMIITFGSIAALGIGMFYYYLSFMGG